MNAGASSLKQLVFAFALGVPALVQAQSGLTLDRWTGISSAYIHTFQSVLSSRAPNTSVVNAGSSAVLQSSPNLDNFGMRLRGQLTIPADGYYTFYVAGDDETELWLSQDSSRFNKERIAYNRGYTALHNFVQVVSQRSRSLKLAAGQICYIEGLTKEGGGQDHLSLGWTYSPVTPTTETAVGTVAAQSWVEQPNGGLQLTVDANDVSGNADNAGFHQTTWSGNGEFVVRLSDVTLPASGAKVGLMLRTSADPGAVMAAIVQTGSGNMTFQRRTVTGANLSNSTYTGLFPWLKLHRNGDVITTNVSLDGIRWFGSGSVTIAGLANDLLVGVCATDGSVSAHVPVTATASDFQLKSLSAVPELIPDQYLTPVVADPADANNDGLPDAWQTTNGLSAAALAAGSGQFDDPDGDGRNNYQEYREGTNPVVAESVAGGLTVQRWLNTAYYNVSELVRDSHFLSMADILETSKGAEIRDLQIYSGLRQRGYLTVPVTGSYRFWIAGADGAELWLSSDQTKYRKQKLCGFGGDTGAGNGIADGTNPHTVWDLFSAQLSAPVQLVAGQKYFIEMLETSTHAGLGWVTAAWARDGGPREQIPAKYLETYLPVAGDADDDYLPDAWETSTGLDPADNGVLDPVKQGEWGDYDGDRLTNHQEYLLGTNPTNGDSDGDGASDFDEINFYRTSPTSSNSIAHVAADPVDLTSYNPQNTSGTWQVFDGGLLGEVFRGHIEWSFTVPQDGWWMLNLKGRLRGKLRTFEELPIGVQVDDLGVAPQTMTFVNGNPSELKVVMPYLTAGSHRVRFEIDNNMGRRTLQIQALEVLSTGGFDGDGNGRSDWLDAILASGNTLAPGAVESVVSPAFVEGAVRHVGGVVGSAGGTAFPIQRGLGDLHWYANVPLAQNGATPISVQFEGGAVTQTRSVEWTRWNALGGTNLTVRAGDAVKIGAWTSPSDAGSSTITVAGTGHPGIAAATGSFVHTFSTAGNFTVAVTHSSGATASRTITVVGADFGQQQAFYADWATWRTFATVPTALWVDAEPSLVIASRKASGSGQQLQLLAGRHGSHALVARLSANGPIVNLGAVQTVGIADALQNDAVEFIGSTADGSRILRSPVVVTDLPPGGRVVITIFRAGVTFLDGTTVRTLTAADFNEGVVYLDFLYPAGMSGGYCHYIDIYDAQNRHLGRH